MFPDPGSRIHKNTKDNAYQIKMISWLWLNQQRVQSLRHVHTTLYTEQLSFRAWHIELWRPNFDWPLPSLKYSQYSGIYHTMVPNATFSLYNKHQIVVFSDPNLSTLSESHNTWNVTLLLKAQRVLFALFLLLRDCWPRLVCAISQSCPISPKNCHLCRCWLILSMRQQDIRGEKLQEYSGKMPGCVKRMTLQKQKSSTRHIDPCILHTQNLATTSLKFLIK